MSVLTQLLLRLAFGLSVAMAVTPSRLVTGGFFRLQTLVVLGLCTLAAAAARQNAPPAFWPAVLAAAASYVGFVFWQAERPRSGKATVTLGAALALAGAWRCAEFPAAAATAARWLGWLSAPTSGLVLGGTLGAMLLGHSYLTSPTMQLGPLRRLLAVAVTAMVLRMIICGLGAGWELAAKGPFDATTTALVALRWLAGFAGPIVLVALAWQTLKVPNTQSATGILYVAVVGVLAGELLATLLSAQSTFPL